MPQRGCAQHLRSVLFQTRHPNLSSQIFEIAALGFALIEIRVLHSCLKVKGGEKLTNNWGQPVGATWELQLYLWLKGSDLTQNGTTMVPPC
jgi:hypothetical protein